MRRLLLIEDEVEIRTMMTEVLVNAGYEVDSAETVAMGSAMIGRGEYDLVITEGRLPDGEGSRIAKRASDTNTPALIMTAYPLVAGVASPRYRRCTNRLLGGRHRQIDQQSWAQADLVLTVGLDGI
jgi:DNA-binding NtrC family response regulator